MWLLHASKPSTFAADVEQVTGKNLESLRAKGATDRTAAAIEAVSFFPNIALSQEALNVVYSKEHIANKTRSSIWQSACAAPIDCHLTSSLHLILLAIAAARHVEVRLA